MAYQLPTLDRDALNARIDTVAPSAETAEEWKEIVKFLFLTRGNTNQLRASKPKIIKDNPFTAKAAYVWRMVAFIVSPNPQHHCMPMTAFFDLPAYDEDGKWRTQLANTMAKTFKPLEDLIVDSVPKNQWVGAIRWARAMGR